MIKHAVVIRLYSLAFMIFFNKIISDCPGIEPVTMDYSPSSIESMVISGPGIGLQSLAAEKSCPHATIRILDHRAGLEPALSGSEPEVLPLDDQ